MVNNTEKKRIHKQRFEIIFGKTGHGMSFTQKIKLIKEENKDGKQ